MKHVLFLGLDLLNIYNRVQNDISNEYEISIGGTDLNKIIIALNAPTGAELMNDKFNYTPRDLNKDGYIDYIIIQPS